jgi:predicted outer membrane protein
MVVNHHKKANAKIAALVEDEKLPINDVGVANPAITMDSFERIIAHLSMLSDADFDHAYLNTMIILHTRNIAHLSGARMFLSASSAKDLVEETLPQLVKHLIAAKNLKEKLTYKSIFNK